MKMIVLIFKATQIHSENNRISIMTIINMKHVQNLPGRVVYNSPSRLAEVLPDKRKWLKKDEPELTDIIKAQVEKVREIFRIIRSELFDPDRPAKRRIIAADAFDCNTTIEQHLLAKFPRNYSSVIKFACYIEENVNSYPIDPIRTWVTIPKQRVVNLIGNAINAGMDRYSVYTIVGTYLWSQLGSPVEQEGVSGQLIQSYSITRMYESLDVSDEKIGDIWEELGIPYQYARTRPGGKHTVSSEVFIPNDNMIFQMTKSAPSFKIPKMRSDAILKLTIPENIIPKMNGYFFHYPVDSEGVFNERVPIIFSNENTITIPLVKNISPAVIVALFTNEELSGLLNHPKANQRLPMIRTILKHASECMENVNKSLTKINHENHRINLTHLDNRDTFHRIITGMSVAGVAVNKASLIKLNLEIDIKKPNSRRAAEKQRQLILEQISGTNGTLHAQYHLKSRTERVYTRHFNIQGLHKFFHDIIVPDSGNRFIYFDIVANDLSMLFNMIDDHEGISMLKASKDPYREIALKAFDDRLQRDRVKAFVSPYLYGAASDTIIKQSKGKLTLHDIDLLKAALKSLFPITFGWLKGIRTDAAKGLIPKKYNSIDNIDIPIPTVVGATMGPAMIIQRYGARLFRAIICSLASIGYKPSVFVHDSLIIQIPESVDIKMQRSEIIEKINLVRQSRGLKAIAIMIGSGKSWKAADTASDYVSLYD